MSKTYIGKCSNCKGIFIMILKEEKWNDYPVCPDCEGQEEVTEIELPVTIQEYLESLKP